ncbi:MAG: hypothetical protein WAN03_09135, partial [Candidatus Sulfotelmatobacter sp.]
MERLRGAFFFVVFLVTFGLLPCACGQTSDQPPAQNQATPTPVSMHLPDIKPLAPPIPGNAPRISKQTRYQIIRDFETQLVYARALFPMGTKGLL